MKFTSSVRTLASALSLAIALTLPTQVRADETWNGGSGTWDFNNSPGWNAGTWTNNDQVAAFNGTPGTITIDNSHGQVGDSFMQFYATGNTGNWDITGGTLAASGNTNYLIYNSYQASQGSVTIDANMTVDTTRGTDRYNIFDQTGGSGGNLILNGNITFGTAPGQGRSLIVGSTNNGTTISLNGVYADSSASGGPSVNLRLGEGGGDHMTYNLNGDFSGLTGGIQIGEGNVYVGTSANLGTGTIGMYDDQGVSTQNLALFGTNGRTIANSIYISAKYDTGIATNANSRFGYGTLGVNSTSAAPTLSTFTGNVGMDSTNLIVTASQNGRAVFDGNIYGQIPNGLIKQGAGTVVLGQNTYGLQGDGANLYDPATGQYDIYSPTPNGTVAANLTAGTTLITNTAGSAFGNNSGVVNLASGATLGGNGYSTQAVVVAGGGIIAPGDPGQAGLSIPASIATLHLTGGLSMASGSTLAFKINGAPGVGSNDMIALGAGALSMAGTINVDFTSLGTVQTEILGNYEWYTLATGTGTWSTSPTFDFTAPAGYRVAHDIYNPTTHTFEVDFVAVPEPSTYAFMLGGLAFLAFCVRRKNRTV